MNKKYQVKALYIPTNRKRTETFIAKNEEELVELLKNSDFEDPFEIKEVFNEPTDKQLEYAKSLKIKIPNHASLEDMSALISRAVEGDNSDPNPELIEYAVDKGFFFSKYVGKKALYNLLFYSLSLRDKIAFFCFSVYRHLSDDRAGNLDNHQCKDLFYNFAESQINNDKFIKSLEKYTGEDIRFFGTLKFSDGGKATGGSMNTIAYRTCSEFLTEKMQLINTAVKTIKTKVSDNMLIQLIESKGKLYATKYYKEKSGINISEAKKYIDDFISKNKLESAKSGCASVILLFVLSLSTIILCLI
jgi:hypothetical protein